jgi:RHS repeat-associated protein
LTFTPVADAYLSSGSPSNNHGSSTTLQIDKTPDMHFLLKFTVTGVNGQPVTNAKLRLYNVNGSVKGGDYYRVSDNTWQEGTVNWNNAPAADPSPLATLGSVSANTWVEVDVTSLVTGDGTYSLRVTTTSTDGADYSSKEGANPPQLVITTGTGATNTPGPSPTPTASRTSTPTATITATRTPTAGPTATPVPFSGASFVYDGDGNRVAQTVNNVTTYFVGNYYEVTNGTVTKYYYAGTQRVAMRKGSTLSYLLSDHLGSTSLTLDSSGYLVSELRYKAWGEVRYAGGNTPTKYSFTGQYSDSYINLLWYGSRHYDPAIGRFIQPDSIVPLASQGVQAWDRYAYVNNAPTRYTDPTGHMVDDGYVGNHRRLDCQKYGQYCNNGKPKSSEELIVMRTPEKKELPKIVPWRFSHDFTVGIHLGPVGNIFVPEYDSDDYNGFPAVFPPYNTDDNFSIVFPVVYDESVGTTMSDILISNLYDGLVALDNITINDYEIRGPSNYLPPGGYQPLTGTGNTYSGNDSLTVDANCHDILYTFCRLESSKIRLNLAISDGLNM